MDVSQLPSVSGQLVTADNPGRADLPGMDHARCAALHNYLVHYAWIAEGRTPARLHDSNSTFFKAHGAAAEALRPRLDPSLAAFLSTAMLPPADAPDRTPPFFFWATGLTGPGYFFANEEADLLDQPVDSLVCLYQPGQGGESGGGLFYHQGCHRAAVFMHMADYRFAFPVEAHPEHWRPLETVLSNWIDLIHLGTVAASPTDAPPALFGSEKFGPWEWRPYGEAQVATCRGAWDRLCDAIEARVLLPSPARTTTTTTGAAEPEPLLTPAVLDAASVPESCFARSFLARARRPSFRHIAPGLRLPPADASEFAVTQPFTNLSRAPHVIPPTCLFSAARGEREATLTRPSDEFCHGFWETPDDSSVPSRVPAGVYSEFVERDSFDNAEERFRLLLPYGLEGDVWDANLGARKSDGSFVRRGATAELFQHGYKPFGGDYYRPQRLERLLDHWRKLVDDGVWPVGPEGVQGTIDTFRKADTMSWRDYVIPPTW